MEERLDPSFEKLTTELLDTSLTRFDSPAEMSLRLYSHGAHPVGRGGKATILKVSPDLASSGVTMSTAIEAVPPESQSDACKPTTEHRNSLASLANAETRTTVKHTPQKQGVSHEDTLQQQIRNDIESIPVIEDSAQTCATSTMIENHLIPQYRRPSYQQINLIMPAFISSFTSPIITLVVGGSQSPACETNPVSFFVHKQVLVKYSRFFSAAFGDKEDETTLQDGWIEKQSLEMHLPEDRVEDIGWLIKWLYWWDAVNKDEPENKDQNDCSCTQASALWHPATDSALEDFLIYQDRRRQLKISPHADLDDLKRPDPPSFGPLIRLYIIADKYSITTDTEALKTLICRRVQTMARTAHCIPNKDDITHLWTNIIHESPIEAMKSSFPKSNPLSQTSSPVSFQPTIPPLSTPSSCSCLKQTFLSLFTSLSPTSQFDLFTTTQEKWHNGFLRDLVVTMVHGKVLDEEIVKEEVRNKERDGMRERHDRMRAGKARIMG